MKEMKELYLNALKPYIREEFKTTRKENSLTQEKMAENLAVERRTYCNVETGLNMCGTLSFILFLLYECKDVDKFLEGMKEVLQEVRKDIQ